MFNRNIHMQHALYMGERKIEPYFVDGYAVVAGVQMAFEYHGCFFHACVYCFTPHDTCPLRNVTFEQIHATSVEKDRMLQSKFGVHLKILCEWVEMKWSHPG